MAISTAGGLAPRGYFMPYRYAADAGRRVADGYPALVPFFDGAAGDFEAMLDALDGYGETLLGFDGPPPEPRWRQDWFPGLDGAVMYATVLDQRPNRIVEVGSGHSTRFMARAIRDGGFDCHLTAIDPAPRADIAALDILTRLRMKGFHLSIDDFGTGYSTMSQLNELPYSEMKLDQSFIRNCVRDAEARAIVESSIELGHKLGMKVVAEGIEKQEDWDLISDLRCDEGQGYFIARPMKAANIPDWLSHWNASLGRV